jgi:hypothetical protein
VEEGLRSAGASFPDPDEVAAVVRQLKPHVKEESSDFYLLQKLFVLLSLEDRHDLLPALECGLHERANVGYREPVSLSLNLCSDIPNKHTGTDK